MCYLLTKMVGGPLSLDSPQCASASPNIANIFTSGCEETLAVNEL